MVTKIRLGFGMRLKTPVKKRGRSKCLDGLTGSGVDHNVQGVERQKPTFSPNPLRIRARTRDKGMAVNNNPGWSVICWGFRHTKDIEWTLGDRNIFEPH